MGAANTLYLKLCYDSQQIMAERELGNHNIVTIGGGTGHSTLLDGLPEVNNPDRITAIVGGADNGGDSGKVVTEIGVSPPGDARQCLLGLAPKEIQPYLIDWLSYRFPGNGSEQSRLAGANLGNLNIAGLERIYGSQTAALEVFQKILRIPGRVMPVTENKPTLMARLTSGKILEGETVIDTRHTQPDFDPKDKIESVFLKEPAYLNPTAKDAIDEADAIVIAPGDLYTSILQILLINGLTNALSVRRSKLIYCGPLMTKPGETDSFKASDCLKEITKYLEPASLDFAIFNDAWSLSRRTLAYYKAAGQKPIRVDKITTPKMYIGPLAKELPMRVKSDFPSPVILRHDSDRLAMAVMEYLSEGLLTAESPSPR